MALDDMQKKVLYKAGQLTRAQIDEARAIYVEMFDGVDNPAALAAIIQAVASNYKLAAQTQSPQFLSAQR